MAKAPNLEIPPEKDFLRIVYYAGRQKGLTVTNWLAAEGLARLWYCVRAFDPARNIPFLVYAIPSIQGQMLTCLTRYYRDRSRREPLTNLPLTRRSDCAADREAIEDYEMDRREAVIEILKGDLLDAREYDIVCKRFGFGCDDMTLEEVAAGYGVTRERIRQIEGVALHKIERSLKTSAGRLEKITKSPYRKHGVCGRQLLTVQDASQYSDADSLEQSA